MSHSVTLEIAKSHLCAKIVFDEMDRAGDSVIAALLDGQYYGDEIELSSQERDAKFILKPPSHVIVDQLDFVDVGTGESLLPRPYTITNFYEVRILEFFEAGQVISGSFLANGLNDDVWVEVSGGGKVYGKGFAKKTKRQGKKIYVFNLSLLSLVSPAAAVVLELKIAGKVIKEPRIDLTSDAIGIVGFADSLTGNTLRGWVLNRNKETDRVNVEILINGRTHAIIEADQFRDDVRLVGMGDGFSGFSVVLPWNQHLDLKQIVSVRLVNSQIELCNSPIEMPPVLQGSFDEINERRLTGWALNNADATASLEVEAICDGHILARSEANLFREDLRASGLNEGLCAFELDIGASPIPTKDRFIFVRIVGSEVILPGSPKLSTN